MLPRQDAAKSPHSVLSYPVPSGTLCHRRNNYFCQLPSKLNSWSKLSHETFSSQSLQELLLEKWRPMSRCTHTHTISNVQYQIQHHRVDKHFTTVSSGEQLFPLKFRAGRQNRWREDFLSYSSHCKMMHWLYLWADISSLS